MLSTQGKFPVVQVTTLVTPSSFKKRLGSKTLFQFGGNWRIGLERLLLKAGVFAQNIWPEEQVS